MCWLDKLKDDDPILVVSMYTLRNKLKEVLDLLNIDSSKYSWHSFRRGGATLASQMPIDPALIKAHGRLNNEAYLLFIIC